MASVAAPERALGAAPVFENAIAADRWGVKIVVCPLFSVHNDLEAIMGSATLGEFPEGLDEEYFLNLQELVNAVHENGLAGRFHLMIWLE